MKIAVRLDPDLNDSVEAFAEQHKVTKSVAIRTLLRAAFERPLSRSLADEAAFALVGIQKHVIMELTSRLREELPDLIEQRLAQG
jgi:hypothetical protein